MTNICMTYIFNFMNERMSLVLSVHINILYFICEISLWTKGCSPLLQ